MNKDNVKKIVQALDITLAEHQKEIDNQVLDYLESSSYDCTKQDKSFIDYSYEDTMIQKYKDLLTSWIIHSREEQNISALVNDLETEIQEHRSYLNGLEYVYKVMMCEVVEE